MHGNEDGHVAGRQGAIGDAVILVAHDETHPVGVVGLPIGDRRGRDLESADCVAARTVLLQRFGGVLDVARLGAAILAPEPGYVVNSRRSAGLHVGRGVTNFRKNSG